MSAFVVTLNLDGQPHGAGSVTGALRFLTPGIDGHEVWQGGAVGAARARFAVCPEDERSELPDSAVAPDVLCIADARLDNRDELIPVLGIDSGVSDTGLICAAYQRWGDDCVSRLIGDFAFVIWEERRRRLFAASDPLGVRTIRYSISGSRVVLGSRTSAVAACLQVTPRPNARLLRDNLNQVRHRWNEETSYEGILRLGPGMALVQSNGTLKPARYCRIGEWPTESFASDEDYGYRFLELLTLSLRARLRSRTPVTISLSGGLDSSALACLSHRLVASSGMRPGLRSVSSVFNNSPRADEQAYLDLTLAACPEMAARKLVSDDYWMFGEFGADRGYQQDEVEAWAGRMLALSKAMAAAETGSRVLISGHWADELLGGYSLSSLLAGMPLKDWPREWGHFRRATRINDARLIGRVAAHRLGIMDAAWVRRLAGRAKVDRAHLRCINAAERHEGLVGNAQVFRRLTFEALAGNAGIEWRFPFLDRRLVEFLLCVPSRLLVQGGFRKVILRSALTNILPEGVRTRTHLTGFMELAQRGLNREGDRLRELLLRSNAVRLGWLAASEVEDRLRDCQSRPSFQAFDRLGAWACTEGWLAAYLPGVH